MPTKPMLPARERNETASQSWHHPVEWAVRSNAKIAVINFAVTNVLSEGHGTVSERYREVTREWTSLSRVQLSQLRGGGCVWQASEIGQDGFQDFDCFCRHAEKSRRLPVFASRTLRPSVQESLSIALSMNRRVWNRRSQGARRELVPQLNPSIRDFGLTTNFRVVGSRDSV